MKYFNNDFIKFIIFVILLFISINIIFISPVYAMGAEDLNDIDYADCLKEDINPITYWMNHPNENDAYAIKQKNIHLYDNPNYRIEPIDYPITYNTSLKSKLFFFIWKKYTDDFDSASHFEQSMGKSYSIRSEVFKDIKHIFKK